MLRKKKASKTVVEVPVLCRFWREDEVWNASAVDLPIAVFGDTFEDAQANMSEALVAHLNALQRLGELDDIVHELRAIARDRSFRAQEMTANEPLVRLSAAIQDSNVMALV